jgi:glycerol-3-phosphate dehydrogenase subunit B
MKSVFPSLRLTDVTAVPTVFGTWKKAALALGTQAAADIRKIPKGEVLVVSFNDVEGYTGEICEYFEKIPEAAGLSFRDAEIELFGSAERMGVFEAAARIDSDIGAAAEAGKKIVKLLSPKTVLALLPPVFGVTKSDEAIGAVSAAAGVHCAELLPGVPSVPGARWKKAMEAALSQGTITVLEERAVSATSEKGLVSTVVTDAGTELVAGSCVLAGGKYFGGGVRLGDSLKEPVFGLPVRCGSASETVRAVDLTALPITGSHPIMGAGVRVNAELRPVDIFGAPVYGNLFAAGSVIEDTGANYGISGIGNAVTQGIRAGRSAASSA